MNGKRYGAVVVGGGHAGAEAAHAIARLGLPTLLLTMNLDTIGQMSCNPAIGGLAKSNLVAEIDALGGLMARIADAAAIQYRRLNTSKGPAVRATRCQCDMAVYRREMQRALFATDGLDLKQGSVEKLILEGGRIGGVITQLGEVFEADTVVLTTGTFLRGVCHVGLRTFEGGRAGGRAAYGLSEVLAGLGLRMGRMKTGTTPRLDGRTIDWTALQEQASEPERRLSFYHEPPLLPQRSCFVTHTNARTHELIRAATDESPLFTGVIEGVGPRYCPSIEDKVVRFADKERHQVFLEPHGLDTPEVYPNGLSTSLPLAAQYAFVRSISGLERAEITRPGYAVEYDCVDPTQLAPSLELRALPGLFLAGQINGTSGYEEAAAQGLIAGLNAARSLLGEDSVVLARDEAYLGVLIDDLVTKGTDEPYRMFTSRAEFRLLLREDNADERLSELGHRLGLLDEAAYARFVAKRRAIATLTDQVTRRALKTNAAAEAVAAAGLGGAAKGATLLALLRRPGSRLATLAPLSQPPLDLGAVDVRVVEAVECNARYAGYIERQRRQAEHFHELEDRLLPEAIEYDEVAGLSREVVEKLGRVRPRTLGQALRIAGITPAAITALMVHIAREPRSRAARG